MTPGGPGLGKDQESLGYVEMPLRSGDIQRELARCLCGLERNPSLRVQKRKNKDEAVGNTLERNDRQEKNIVN